MSQCHMCIGLVQMEAERDAQAGQARRVVTELQTVTAQRDRLLAIVARLLDVSEDVGWTAPDIDAGTWELYESAFCMECGGGSDLVGSEPMDPVDADLIRRAVDTAGGAPC